MESVIKSKENIKPITTAYKDNANFFVRDRIESIPLSESKKKELATEEYNRLSNIAKGTLIDLKGRPSNSKARNKREENYWGVFGGRLDTNLEQLGELFKGVAKTVGASAGIAAGAYYAPLVFAPTFKGMAGTALLGAGEGLAYGMVPGMSTGDYKTDALYGAASNVLSVPISKAIGKAADLFTPKSPKVSANPISTIGAKQNADGNIADGRATRFYSAEQLPKAPSEVDIDKALSSNVGSRENIDVLNSALLNGDISVADYVLTKNRYFGDTQDVNSMIDDALVGMGVNPRRYRARAAERQASTLPQAPFVIGDIGATRPIQSLYDLSELPEGEFTRFRELARNNPAILSDYNIDYSGRDFAELITSRNRELFNSYLHNASNINAGDLNISNAGLFYQLDPNNLFTYNKPGLIKAESIKDKLKTAFKVAKKSLSDFDLKVGEKIDPVKSIDRDVLADDVNKELAAGVGIKKTNIPIKVKRQGNSLLVYLDPKMDGSFIYSGQISLANEGVEQRKATEIFADFMRSSPADLFSKKKLNPIGLQKTMDFPTSRIDKSTDFDSNIDVTGVGGELGEAIKRGIKKQNKSATLLSSTLHTDDGQLRYLNEYLNGRKTFVSADGNTSWKKEADAVKKLYPNGIKKSETRELLLKNPKLAPKGVKFAYSLAALLSAGYTLEEANEMIKEDKTK